MKKFDVIIIGAGAVGNAAAREIACCGLSVLVLEAQADTCFGISGRNSGVLHAGFNNIPGSLMARFCVEGNEGFSQEAARLGIKFKRTGKKVVALHPEDREGLEKLYDQGQKNGVKGLEIQEKGWTVTEEDGTGREVPALYSPMTGIFDPFEYTIALARSAQASGAEFVFDHEVRSVTCHQAHENTNNSKTAADHIYTVDDSFSAPVIINSAGLGASHICSLAGLDGYETYPCRGEYHILTRKLPGAPEIPVYPVPSSREGGLGVHLTPTIDGNLMIGPSAEYIDSTCAQGDSVHGSGAGFGCGAGCETTEKVMKDLFLQGHRLCPAIETSHIIRSFAGIRPKATGKGGYADFSIDNHNNFIVLFGIESPGLTSSVPIARYICRMLGISRIRPYAAPAGPHGTDGMSRSTSEADSAAEDIRDTGPRLGMICRCESVTGAEILTAFDEIIKLGARPTLRGIKIRTRAGMGDCQGGFCTSAIIDLLMKKRDIDPLAWQQDYPGSGMFTGRIR